MTALLTDNLPLLAGAPNGIKKLRELILELAVRGRLVPQDPSDEPASELLKRIAEEKTRQVSEGKIKKQKPLSEITDVDKPFPLPKSWAWLRLGDLTLTILSGGTPSKNVPEYWGGGIPWASVKDLNVCRDLVATQDYITEEGLAAGSKLANKGEVLICTRMGLGKVAVAAMDVAINQDLKALRLTCHLNLDYFLNFYRTLSIVGSGMTVAGIKQDELLGFLVPVPPLAEQHRIVDKVDELMALCDRLETQQGDAESAHAQLVQALLGSLIQASDATDFATNWQRLSEHFHTLFTTESSIDSLKQTLLQLAVMGKLVPQDPSDEPASVLLERIAEEKERLVNNGKIKRQKPLADVEGNDVIFELPSNWAWTRVGNVCAIKIELVRPEDFPLLRQVAPDCIEKGTGRLTDNRTVKESGVKGPNSRFFAGQVVYSKIRPSLSKAVLVDFDGLCSADMYPIDAFISSKFLLKVILSEVFLEQVRIAENRIKMPKLNQESLTSFMLPIPPFAEQGRIVAKLDELMVLCDQLKENIAKARSLNEQLTCAVVTAAIAGRSAASASNVVHLSSYLVRKLADQRTFGRTAHMKWLFLADQHLDLELGMAYERKAAGPLDTLIYQIEDRAAQAQLYVAQKETLRSGAEKIVYRPDIAIDRAADAGAVELGSKCAELDRLIGLLGSHKTDDLEIVATLYAVWNDALAEGRQPDDDWLINEFRTNWHKGKERFAPELLAHWLGWMRDHRLVPKGKKNSTRHQTSLLH